MKPGYEVQAMKRKGSGNGGVDVRGNSIRIRFTFDGRRQQRTVKINGKALGATPISQQYAEDLLREIQEKIRHGTFVMADYFPDDPAKDDPGTSLSVGSQLDAWLKAQRIEGSTRAGYSSAIKFWKEVGVTLGKKDLALGDVPVRALHKSQILGALASRPDLSGKTVNNYVSVLREALALAVEDGLLIDNPAARIKRAKHQKEPPEPFSREESNLIIDYMEAHYPPAVWNLVEFWFWTGLRTSEIFGLQWSRVDLPAGNVLIADALVRGTFKDTTKTCVSRVVTLNARALAALKRQREHTQLKGEFVFLDPRYGTPWTEERAFRRSFWTPALKALGIRYRRPYNMRHSYATAMLMAGMNPAYCANQLGHSVEMFLRTYATWLDGAQNKLEMARLEKTLKDQKDFGSLVQDEEN